MANFNDLIIAIGGFGRYQFLLYVWYIVGCLVNAGNMAFMVFGMIQPNKDSGLNATNSSNCVGEYEFYSIALEWDLCGELEYVSNLITSVQFAGMLFGPLVAGQIADRFGRKAAFYIFLTGCTTARLVSYFLSSWQSYAASMFFLGFFFSGVFNVQCVFFVEMIPAKWRMISYALSWPLGYIWLGVAAMLTAHWRPLTLVVASPYIILVPLGFLLHESPQWLLNKGRVVQARKVISGIAKFNKITPQDMEKIMDEVMPLKSDHQTPKVLVSFWHLFYSRQATMKIVLLTLMSVTTAFVYYGLMFNMGKLAGDTAVNFIIMMSCRLAINTTLPFIDRYLTCLTRRRLYLTAYILVSLSLIAKVIFLGISMFDDTTQQKLVTASSIVGLGGCGLLWATVDMYTVELIPTLTRNMGAGLSNAITRIGSILAPQVILLYNVYPPAPFLVFLAVLSGTFFTVYPLIPETKGKVLPDLPPEALEMKLMKCIR